MKNWCRNFTIKKIETAVTSVARQSNESKLFRALQQPVPVFLCPCPPKSDFFAAAQLSLTSRASYLQKIALKKATPLKAFSPPYISFFPFAIFIRPPNFLSVRSPVGNTCALLQTQVSTETRNGNTTLAFMYAVIPTDFNISVSAHTFLAFRTNTRSDRGSFGIREREHGAFRYC